MVFIERFSPIINPIAENLKVLDGIIGLDIDAVTQATYIRALAKVSRELGLRSVIAKERITDYWGLVKIIQHYGVSEEAAWKLARGAWNTESVFLESPPMPGISSLLKIFRDLEMPYVFISSRPAEFLNVTQTWFAKTFPWVNPENIILGRKKPEVVKEYNVGLHLEDSAEEALAIVRESSAKVILIPQPWNLSDDTFHPQIERVGPYSQLAGVWPAIRFLASHGAKDFLA